MPCASYGDVVKQQYFIDQKPSEKERQIAMRQLRNMANWASSPSCRRRALLAYFDEQFGEQSGPCCDVCREPALEVDCTIPAQMFLSCVKRTGEQHSIAHVISVLRGSRKGQVLQLGHDRLSTYGIGRDRSSEEWQHLAGELMRRGYLRWVQGMAGSVESTDLGDKVLFKGERVLLAALPEPELFTPGPAAQPHQDLFDRLRTLRKRLADEREVPPYVIFHDATLAHISAQLPMSLSDLLRVQGVGERKALDLGEAVLECVAEYVRETGARPVEEPSSPPKVRTTGAVSSSAQATLELFRFGLGVDEIAAQRGLVVSTIEGHLAEAVEAGEAVDLDRLIGEEKRSAIAAAMAELGLSYLAPVKERLGEGYTYGELRLVRAVLNRQNQSPA